MRPQTCSSCVECLPSSGQTTDLSLSLRPSGTGSKPWEPRRLTLSRDRPGRTDTAKASTGECEMNCSTERYSTRCGKPKLLSKDGGTITTPNDPIVHWDIARLRQKPTSRWTKGQSCTNFQIGPLKWGCSSICRTIENLKTTKTIFKN